MNLRLKRAGGKILQHPDILSNYYAKSDFRSFCIHNFKNGFGIVYPLKFVNRMPISWRHLVPLMFTLSLMVSSLLSIFSHIFLLLFLFTIGSYTLINMYFSIKITLKEKNFRYFFLIPIIFATLHISYGFGSLWGLSKAIISVEFWKNRFSSLG